MKAPQATTIQTVASSVDELGNTVSTVVKTLDELGNTVTTVVKTLDDVLNAVTDFGSILIGQMDELGNRLDGRVDKLDSRIDKLDSRLSNIEQRMTSQQATQREANTHLKMIENRLGKIEGEVKANGNDIKELYTIYQA